MNQLDIAIGVTAAVVFAIGILSNAIKRSVLQEPLIAALVGIAVGPYMLGWLDIEKWGSDQFVLLEEIARFTLAVGLMGVALRLRRDSFRPLIRPAILLLTIGLVGMWGLSSLILGWWLGLSFWIALLLGAIVTPTDPVVASSIVSGDFAKKHLPRNLREIISLESGANDGLASALLLLPLMVLSASFSEAVGNWALNALLVDTVGAIGVGVVIGLASARLLAVAERMKLVENTSLLGYSLAFTLLTMAVASLLGLHELLAVFAAGLIFNFNTREREEHVERNIQEAVAKLLTLPMFVVLGVALPLGAWLDLGWPLLAAIAFLLLFRRLPVVLAMSPWLRRDGFGNTDSRYMGWFGPIGVAAIFYAALSVNEFGERLVWHVASAAIFASILVHGMTAAWLTKAYARHRRSEVNQSSGG